MIDRIESAIRMARGHAASAGILGRPWELHVADPSLEARKYFAERYPDCNVYEDAEAMIATRTNPSPTVFPDDGESRAQSRRIGRAEKEERTRAGPETRAASGRGSPGASRAAASWSAPGRKCDEGS